MPGRLPGVALLAIFVALVLPSASRTEPPQHLQGKHARSFFAACTAGAACIDLDVKQGDTPDPVPAGNTLIYRVTLQNHGPDAADNVFLEDTIPFNSECISISTNVDMPGAPPSCNPPGGACSIDGPTIFCTFGTVENTDLSSGPGPRVITITLRSVSAAAIDQPPDYPRTITNAAVAFSRSDANDRNPGNEQANEDTTVTSPGELKLTKTHPPDDPVPPTNNFDYQLRLDNTAEAATLEPFDASSHPGNPESPITVTDTLPHGFRYVGTDDPEDTGVDNQCTATPAGPLENSIVTCHPQTSIPAGGHYIIYLIVNPTQTGTFTNFASTTKEGGELDTSDNSASDLTHVACPKPGTSRVPALCVTKTDSQDPVPQGQAFSYTIKIQNQRTGSEDAYTEPLKVTDTIPPGMTVVSVSGAPCGPVSGGVLTCTLQPDIGPGAARFITVNVLPLQIGTFENVACIHIGSGEGELLTCANQPTTIIGAADLEIEKTGSPDPVDVNSELTYTIKVTNKGPSGVPHVQMDDSIPDTVTFISSSVAPGPADCSLPTPTTFHCDLGFMNAAATQTVTIVVMPTVPGLLTNTATVANDGTPNAPVDFNLANNKATFTTDARAADLALTKAAAPTPLGIGQPLTFTMTVTNKGPGAASGVVFTDPLPDSVAFPVTTTTKGTCTGTATITCDLDTMAVDEVVTITIQVTPTNPGPLTNTAHVESKSFDTDTTNNDASASATVTAADVTISKGASPDPVAVGTSLTYSLQVHNNGPNRATGVTVRDTLPDAVALPVATPSQGTCFGSPTVTCVLGDLAPDFTATVTIVVTPLVASGVLTNNASVTSAFDLNSANNTASATTRVIDPRLDVTPDIGDPGFVPSAVGTDFPPNAPLELVWQPGIGKQTVTTGADGSFKVSMLVFPNDTVGPRLLMATALQTTNPATAFLPTSTDFLVVPPTAQPFQVKPQVAVTKLVQRSG